MHAYNSIRSCDTSEQHALPFQYKDYVSWQNWQLNTASYLASQQYWLNRFNGEVPVLQLPEDFSRPPVKTYDGAYVDFTIDNALYDQVKEYCRQKDVSLFTLLLA